MIETIRAYSSVSPFGFLLEFRPAALENWHEAIEGDTSIDVIVSEDDARKLFEHYDGDYSLIISLMNDSLIRHEFDFSSGLGDGERASVKTFIYDSYYVQTITPEEHSRNYRLTCVGLKEYLGKRLAIPSSLNTTAGTITVPDGSQETKPIPTSHMLRYVNKSWKGIVYGLIQNTNNLQQLPVTMSDVFLDGPHERTYLLKDMRSIKEVMDNMTDDINGPDFVLDGGTGTRDNVNFSVRVETNLSRGNQIELSTRNAEIFKPRVEITQNEATNNVWTVGNASDGNVLLAHQINFTATSKILLQTADTSRSDIQTGSVLLSYTMGIIARSGAAVRTMEMAATNNDEMFRALTGTTIYIKSPENPDIDDTSWRVISREINRSKIIFDMIEIS